jgi:hypothetical protein
MEVPVRYGMTIICAIAATACAGEGASGGAASWRAVADTVADTITVRTVSGSVWGDTATLVEEVRIGTMEGADEYIIGDARSIAVGNEGRIYLLDRQVPVVRAYSADGTYLFDAGREGGGPGEYERPDGMNTLPDGRVVVRDPGASRVVVFSADGEFLEQWSRTKGGGFNTSRRFYADTAGYSYWMILLEAGLPPWEWSYGLMPISPTGEQQDTVGLRPGAGDREPRGQLQLSLGAVHSGRRVDLQPAGLLRGRAQHGLPDRPVPPRRHRAAHRARVDAGAGPGRGSRGAPHQHPAGNAAPVRVVALERARNT